MRTQQVGHIATAAFPAVLPLSARSKSCGSSIVRLALQSLQVTKICSGVRPSKRISDMKAWAEWGKMLQVDGSSVSMTQLLGVSLLHHFSGSLALWSKLCGEIGPKIQHLVLHLYGGGGLHTAAVLSIKIIALA